MMTIESKRDFIEAAYLQLLLKESGYKLIYLDEFLVSMHKENIYSWSERGKSPIVFVNPSSFIMSFVIAVSKDRVEGIMTSNHSINSESFSIFLKDAWRTVTEDDNKINKIWIIFDNASIPLTTNWIKLMRKIGWRWISIPPYSPQLNAAEKFIAVIKHKLKSEWINS